MDLYIYEVDLICEYIPQLITVINYTALIIDDQYTICGRILITSIVCTNRHVELTDSRWTCWRYARKVLECMALTRSSYISNLRNLIDDLCCTHLSRPSSAPK